MVHTKLNFPLHFCSILITKGTLKLFYLVLSTCPTIILTVSKAIGHGNCNNVIENRNGNFKLACTI